MARREHVGLLDLTPKPAAEAYVLLGLAGVKPVVTRIDTETRWRVQVGFGNPQASGNRTDAVPLPAAIPDGFGQGFGRRRHGRRHLYYGDSILNCSNVDRVCPHTQFQLSILSP